MGIGYDPNNQEMLKMTKTADRIEEILKSLDNEFSEPVKSSDISVGIVSNANIDEETISDYQLVLLELSTIHQMFSAKPEDIEMNVEELSELLNNNSV